VTLLADDVGLGKTISAGLVASEIIARAQVSKILIVCPKLLGPQWQAELQAKFDIPAEIATGRELIAAEPEDVGAVITTYASGRLHLEKIPEDRFQMLVLDEAHKLRNLYGVDHSRGCLSVNTSTDGSLEQKEVRRRVKGFNRRLEELLRNRRR
jgi:N12 class adenine-specific DNA methylase